MKPEDLHDIRIEYKGRTITAATYQIYIPRTEFVRSVPYVYLPKSKLDEGIQFLQNYSKKERITFTEMNHQTTP